MVSESQDLFVYLRIITNSGDLYSNSSSDSKKSRTALPMRWWGEPVLAFGTKYYVPGVFMEMCNLLKIEMLHSCYNY